ncbi:MAG: DUF89 family protein, partial [Candidatus Heimdallarchaeota archaeon]|nr:DUF89 family protein [Candidatus Heimdallarchaeota archaeon]
VVKNGSISNDATLQDAQEVGLDEVVNEIITTGSADLGVNQENASLEMKKALQISDFVIAKGQSNIESLWDNVHLRKGPTGFLLVAKCDVIANALHVPINSPIILFTNPK